MTDSLDEKFRRDKRAHWCGRAKVSLQNLQYYGSSARGEINKKQINHLKKVYNDEGCMRLHSPENYVPVVISSADLAVGLQYSNLRQVDIRQEGEPRFLRFPENIQIKVLHGEHRLRAAEEFLEPTDRWWSTVLYDEGKDQNLISGGLWLTSGRPWTANKRGHSWGILAPVEI